MSWTDLPADEARCIGSRDAAADKCTCPVRNGCKRYRAAVEGQFGRNGNPAKWHLWMCTTAEHEQRLPVDGGEA